MAQKTIIYKDCPIDISYEILNFNSPRTLVILHGWGSNKRLMKQAFGESFGDFCHLYIDMPGFGNSSNPTFSMDTFDYAKILEIFLLSLEIQEFVVMGHSFGGKVATLLNPRELILLSSAGILEEKSLKVKSKIFCSKILNKISPSLAKIFKGILRSQDVQNMNEVMYQTFKKVVSFSNAEMDKFSTASLITRSTNDIQQIQMVCAIMIRMIAYAPILGIGGVIKIAQTGAGMGWIIVLALVVILGYVAVLMAVTMPKFKLMQKLVDKVNLVSREILTGLSVIRAFGREKKEEERFDDANRDLTKTMLFTNRVMNFMMPGMMLIMNLLTVGIVWFGAHHIDEGTMQVGAMTAFITYAMMIVMAFLMLTMLSIMLPRAAVAAERIDEVIRTESSIEDKEQPQELKAQEGVVRFSHVSFRYPGAETEVLKDIDFVAEPGKTTAIIGSTGCGKSTLVNLIPRLYDVTEGAVTVDGQDIRDIRMADLRKEIGFVPQKGVLFSGTIATNLRFGKADATDAQIQEAASIAQAADFIAEKSEGYESPIAQGGSNVSGGQKQRLAIARAIAKQPKIYIFDDSFSALDLKTDAALRKALAAKVKNSTVIIVAQRISTILHAEQILVLDEGRIVGKGTHEELLKNCDTYRQIAKSQLSAKELGMEESEVSVNE